MLEQQRAEYMCDLPLAKNFKIFQQINTLKEF
jgi:hypothetical protein